MAERRFQPLTDRGRRRILAQIVEHHRGRKNHRNRIGFALSGDIRSRAVHRLKQAGSAAEAGGRQQTERPAERGGGVGKDVTEDVAGQNHIELTRIDHHLHRGVVDVHVLQFNI